MSLSIRWRLTLWITATLVATLVVIFFILNFALRQILTSDLDDDLSRGANQISALLLIQGSVDDPQEVQEIVDGHSVGGLASGFVVLVRDPQGNVVASTAGVNPEEFALDQGDLARLLAGDLLSRNVDIRGGEEVRVRSESVTLGGGVLGIVQVGESTDLISRTLDRLRTLFIVVGAGAVVVALVIADWLSRRALRPIKNVAAVAARIEASD